MTKIFRFTFLYDDVSKRPAQYIMFVILYGNIIQDVSYHNILYILCFRCEFRIKQVKNM